jgi:hypothetical protein
VGNEISGDTPYVLTVQVAEDHVDSPTMLQSALWWYGRSARHPTAPLTLIGCMVNCKLFDDVEVQAINAA